MSSIGNKEIFSTNLRFYMERRNKSRNEICEALNFKYTTFTDWYNGVKYPRIDNIEKLANYFGISKSDLIEKKDKNNDEQDTPYKPTDEDIKFALFDGADNITDEMYEEVKRFAEYVKQRENK